PSGYRHTMSIPTSHGFRCPATLCPNASVVPEEKPHSSSALQVIGTQQSSTTVCIGTAGWARSPAIGQVSGIRDTVVRGEGHLQVARGPGDSTEALSDVAIGCSGVTFGFSSGAIGLSSGP